MDDKELLEQAALAVGMPFHGYAVEGEMEGLFNHYGGGVWNPLLSDGDALRLAVDLDLDVFPSDMPGKASAEDGAGVMAGVMHGDDKRAAVRRAITRAAAKVYRARLSK